MTYVDRVMKISNRVERDPEFARDFGSITIASLWTAFAMARDTAKPFGDVLLSVMNIALEELEELNSQGATSNSEQE